MNSTGWSKQTPTIYISGERDRIDARVGKIEYSISIPPLSTGLMPFLNCFNKTYYGYIKPDYFRKKWQLEWNLLMKNLQDIDATQLPDWENYSFKSLSFYFMMLRIAVNQEWQWPALFYRDPSGEICHENGTSRLITTGLCRPNPWEHYRVLLQEFPDCLPDDIFDNYCAVNTDQDLHDVFKMSFNNEIPEPESPVKIGIVIEQIMNRTRARMRYVNLGQFEDEPNEVAQNLMQDFLMWKKEFGPKPTVFVYSNSPDLITDLSNSWNIIYVGKLDKNKIYESDLYRITKKSTHGPHHVFYHCGDRKIDLGDFLPWMGLEHSSYIGPNWSFALARPSKNYKSLTVDVSYIH